LKSLVAFGIFVWGDELGFLILQRMSFSVAFFHMGKFESFKDGFLRYNEGEEHVFHELDLDRCSYFEALSILKEEFKYDEAMKLWWKPKRGRMDRDLRPFVSDNDALQLCACAERKKERKGPDLCRTCGEYS